VSPHLPPVRVVSAAQSAARDASAIAAGIPPRALMQRAGAAVAAEIAIRAPERLTRGVLVLAGPGNNGGDGWVIARALHACGADVRVIEPLPARTDDASAERALALAELGHPSATSDEERAARIAYRGEALVIDALLGTGSTGAPRGAIADALDVIRDAREHGAFVAAVDLPTGLDATSGDAGNAVPADLTLTFGTVKRGHLIARGTCGTIVVLDIGLGAHAQLGDGAPALVDERFVAARVPRIEADAHKGTRRKLAILGGAEGMAGASVLAARAAMRSGIGMVKLVVAPASLRAVQEAEPLALASAWPDDASAGDIGAWADALVIGPGLGRTPEARTVLTRVLRAFRGPVVLDADALNAFAGELPALRELLADRPAVLTPHPAEFGRLSGRTLNDVLANRFDIGAEVARATAAVVLLKGVPTVLTAPDGRSLASASGTPVLAAAGSGDVLAGIAGTLVAQIDDPLDAAACAAWIHGRAAERACTSADADPGAVRGTTLDDVLRALAASWTLRSHPTRYPVLAELPAVGER
jgi:hydroxyethylthiazole kinase-like uncharacterized protein yjeF